MHTEEVKHYEMKGISEPASQWLSILTIFVYLYKQFINIFAVAS